MACPRLLRDLACCLLALAAPAALAGDATSRFDCRVTGTQSLAGLAPGGGPAQLTQFTCRGPGGLLDGVRATGTSIWSGQQRDGLLLGSLVVATKAGSTVVYEVTQVTRHPRLAGANFADWAGRGTGIYKLATGDAIALAGRTFHSAAKSAGPGAFTIETIVEDD